MKKIFFIMFLLLAGTLGLTGTSQAYTNVSFSIGFHDALAPYGTWFNYSNYGNCWRPNAYAGWSPYTEGHWVYTSYGPMWDSPEPYGWATYHYGQWVYSASYGWIWVPGYDYYPSRVSWAYGNDYLAWSPVYPAPSYASVNLWFGIDRHHWGYNDYRNVILRGDRVRPLFERRAVQIRHARLDRRDFERFAGRRIDVVPVDQRVVRADNRQVKVVVPRNRAQVVERELTRAQKQRVADHRNDRFNDNNRNDRYHTNDRNSRNDRIVERRDSKGNRVYENRNSRNDRVYETKSTKKQTSHSNREVTTRYSGKKLISPNSKSYNHNSRSNDSKYNHNSRSNDHSRNFSSKSSTREVSRRETVRQSPERNREISGKYSSSSHRPEMRQSSKQVREVSRKEVHSNKTSSHHQNRKPQKKH
jgi:hypothetical protein